MKKEFGIQKLIRKINAKSVKTRKKRSRKLKMVRKIKEKSVKGSSNRRNGHEEQKKKILNPKNEEENPRKVGNKL